MIERFSSMKTMPAGQFKVHCLKIMDEVQSKRQAVLITKRGKPVATISPVASDSRHGPKDLIADFRKQFAKSLKPFTIEEIEQLKDAGRR